MSSSIHAVFIFFLNSECNRRNLSFRRILVHIGTRWFEVTALHVLLNDQIKEDQNRKNGGSCVLWGDLVSHMNGCVYCQNCCWRRDQRWETTWFRLSNSVMHVFDIRQKISAFTCLWNYRFCILIGRHSWFWTNFFRACTFLCRNGEFSFSSWISTLRAVLMNAMCRLASCTTTWKYVWKYLEIFSVGWRGDPFLV